MASSPKRKAPLLEGDGVRRKRQTAAEVGQELLEAYPQDDRIRLLVSTVRSSALDSKQQAEFEETQNELRKLTEDLKRIMDELTKESVLRRQMKYELAQLREDKGRNERWIAVISCLVMLDHIAQRILEWHSKPRRHCTPEQGGWDRQYLQHDDDDRDGYPHTLYWLKHGKTCGLKHVKHYFDEVCPQIEAFSRLERNFNSYKATVDSVILLTGTPVRILRMGILPTDRELLKYHAATQGWTSKEV